MTKLMMDSNIILDQKDYFYGEDFLEQMTTEYQQWSSLLDVNDASPSEILADAVPLLASPFSPIKSSSTESSNSDSSSEDDSKNSSSSDNARESSQSPLDWICSLDDEPTIDLKPEDVDQFLQKCAKNNEITSSNDPLATVRPPERNGPVMSIENGVIKIEGIKPENDEEISCKLSTSPKQNGKMLQNAYFKVVNENYINGNTVGENNYVIPNEKGKVVMCQKKLPNILKRSSNILVSNVVTSNITNGPKIAITPLQLNKNNCAKDNNRNQIKVSPPVNNIVLSYKPVSPKSEDSPTNSSTIVQTGVIIDDPNSNHKDFSNYSEAELKAIKKHQRMIKNRESACQSRQKKKDYVTALEQQLLEAHQEIAKLRLENKLLRDQLETRGPTRKIPRLDSAMLTPKRNIAVIFAMVFMVSLNFSVLPWNSKPFVGPSQHRSTRHLLWSEDNSDEVLPDYDDGENRTYTDCQNVTMNPGDFINQTESIRIASDLNRWIGGVKSLNWSHNAPRDRRKVYLSEEKINGGLLETYRLFNKMSIDNNILDFPGSYKSPVKNLKERSRLRRMRKNKDLDFPHNEIIDYGTLYPKPSRKAVNDFDMDDFGEWNALLEALHRRDDTFYVVGVGKGEHLLLPAVSHNVTRPPKMALILPARTGNDSMMNGHVTLMQIDCSVVNTTLVKLKSDALPGNVKTKPTHKAKPYHEDPNTEQKKVNRSKFSVINNDIVNMNKGIINNRSLDKSEGNISGDINVMNESVSRHKLDDRKEDIFAEYVLSKLRLEKNVSNNLKDNVQINKDNVTKSKVKMKKDVT